MQPSTIFSPDLIKRQPRLDEIKRVIASSTGAPIWEEITQAATAERDIPPYLVDSIFPGRDGYSAELKGMDYTLCRAISLRITPKEFHHTLAQRQASRSTEDYLG